ncbi:siroheme synthase CysG [Teredinibacter sp. KSP-S5-2]|uniref:siroheme synthase CysG n=1 Tax=Teredinibacter sp. KSP-S5-2 TaxID=3034506 RepID=UPI0029346244|nr:siroheme synthase CysG [Teredinibacter sp. KSP-S5-2]WNO07543.1 siroheme synthase CysG [Teredinibacter sp. KSP-S5-2]
MDYLPLFFDIENKPCLIVGGGSVATRKARLLLKAKACISVVAPEIDDELLQMVYASDGMYKKSRYQTKFIDCSVLVIAATNDSDVNQHISNDCHRHRIPVNVVDQPELCSVIVPAIVDRNPLLVAVTSGGYAPVLARRVRSKIESLFPGSYGHLAKLVGRYRDLVKTKLPAGDARRRFWEKIIDGPVGEHAISGNREEAELLLKKAIETDDFDSRGEVYLVGAGPGDPDLLTFKALRLMQRAEIVLYDRLVSKQILEMVRRDAELVYVGKRREQHAVQQSEINQLLVKYAKEGKRVLRLKGGDPFIFGRGGEEIDLLAEENIPFQVVPGITAASGCSAYSGIPLTHRDYSQSVRFITGHLKEGVTNLRWKEFVEPHQTLVFYMGLAGLRQICEQMIQHGKSAETPAALVEKGTLEDQKVHISNLAELPDLVEQHDVHAPTLLIIGEVVQLHKKLNWYKK